MDNKMLKQGLVIGIISEFCYVKCDNTIYECKAKGLMRFENQVVIVGDYVTFEVLHDNVGIINSILERKNQLYRPKIANIDQVIIITSVVDPKFNSLLLDKYLMFIENLNIKPIIAFTKVDLLDDKDKLWDDYLRWYPKLGYESFFLSNKDYDTKEWKKFEKILVNKISVFIGQTGSGKSTTLNTLLKSDIIKTQEISKALGRGKHTTTSVQFYDVLNGMIADSPGFSSFNLINIQKNEKPYAYRIFRENIGKCKFRGCMHHHEIGCVIKDMVEKNIIPNFFYQDYIKILEEEK